MALIDQRSPAAALALTLILVACGGEETARSEGGGRPARAVPVVAQAVNMDARRTRIEAVGTARALRSVDVFSEAAGEVTAVNFQPGDAVSAGDVLVSLDARDERLALQLAELRYGEAQRQLRRYLTANAAAELTVPETTVDTAETALESARIERDRASLALERRSVKAAFDGYVGITDVDVGDRIDTTTQITTLDDRSSLLVSFDVPEAYVRRITIDDPVSLEVWAVDGPKARGRVVDIGSRIDPVSRAFAARAQVLNSDDRLRPGMSFRVRLELEDGVFAVVPELSLQWGADGAYVWVAEDERARRVPVRLVQRDNGRVLVDGPLAPGDRVISEGVQSMRENAALRLMDAAALARDAGSVLNGTKTVD